MVGSFSRTLLYIEDDVCGGLKAIKINPHRQRYTY